MRPWVRLAVGGAVYAIVVVWAALQLPADGVPLHFGLSGSVDRVGTRGDALALLIIVGGFLFVLGVAVVLVVRRAPLRILNIPYKAYWSADERQELLRAMLAVDVATVIGGVLVFLSLLPILTVLALGPGPISPLLLWVPIGILVVALVGWVVWIVRIRYRPRD